jgi:hypothetical protein
MNNLKFTTIKRVRGKNFSESLRLSHIRVQVGSRNMGRIIFEGPRWEWDAKTQKEKTA